MRQIKAMMVARKQELMHEALEHAGIEPRPANTDSDPPRRENPLPRLFGFTLFALHRDRSLFARMMMPLPPPSKTANV